jgi:hypothetical protein
MSSITRAQARGGIGGGSPAASDARQSLASLGEPIS